MPSGDELKGLVRDALSGQTISYDEQDKLDALLGDDMPSDGKELKKKFYAAIPAHDIMPAQANKLNKIWGDLSVSDADPKTPPHVEPASMTPPDPTQGGLQPPAG